MLTELVKDPSNGIDVSWARVLSVDQDIVQVCDDEDMELFCQGLVNYKYAGPWPLQGVTV